VDFKVLMASRTPAGNPHQRISRESGDLTPMRDNQGENYQSQNKRLSKAYLRLSNRGFQTAGQGRYSKLSLISTP
jgi:hypothetical protein